MVGQLVTLISRRAFASDILALSSRFSSRFVNNVVNFGARALPRLGARPIRIANSSCSVLRGASCLLLGRLSRGLAVFASRTVHRVFRVNRGELNRPIVKQQQGLCSLIARSLFRRNPRRSLYLACVRETVDEPEGRACFCHRCPA